MPSDLRAAARSLRGRPGLSLAMVATLALGIGAVTALFSVVDAVLLRSLPFGESGRLVMVHQYDRVSETTREASSVPDYYDLAARARSFSRLAAFASTSVSLAGAGGEPRRLTATGVTHTYFPALELHPLLGRAVLPDEDRPGGARVAVLSEELWRSAFGADPGVLGRAIRLDDESHTIVGVMPRGSSLPGAAADLWVPLQLGPASTPRSLHNVFVLGRLGSGITVDAAQAEAAGIAADLERDFAETNRGRGFSVESLTDVMVGAVRPALLVLLGAVTLVLLIACVNVANLLLAQGWARSREIALRRTLGASLPRLTRQFLAESLLLAVAGGTLGVLLAVWGLDLLLRLAPSDLPRLETVRVDVGVLTVAIAVTMSVALVFGLLPTLQARRIDLHAALQGAGNRGATGGVGSRRIRDLLVAAEVALSVVLVVGAGLLLRSLGKLQAVDPGFRTEQVVKLDLTLPASRYPQDFSVHPHWTAVSAFYQRLLERAAVAPGVGAVALAANHPLAPGFTNSFVIVGREAEYTQQPEIAIRIVSPATSRSWTCRCAEAACSRIGTSRTRRASYSSTRRQPGASSPEWIRWASGSRSGVASARSSASSATSDSGEWARRHRPRPIRRWPRCRSGRPVSWPARMTGLCRRSKRRCGRWTPNWRSAAWSRSTGRSRRASRAPDSPPSCSVYSPRSRSCWRA